MDRRTLAGKALALLVAGMLAAGVVPALAADASIQPNGTGFVVDERGYVLTCNHVIKDLAPDSLTVVVRQQDECKATVVASDPENDLALLKIETGGRSLDALSLGSSARVARQDPVYAVGFPQAIDLHEEATVTPGVVSRIVQAPDPLLEGHPRKVLQLTASVNPGNSGGPLLNDCAQVVGVVFGKRIGTEGMNFAIWSDLALPLLEANVPDYQRGPISDEKVEPREIDRRGTRSVVLIAGRPGGGRVVPTPPVDSRIEPNGSGFVVDDRGYVLTCNHVIEDLAPDSLTVVVRQEHECRATVVATDSENDLALLKIDSAGRSLDALSLGSSSRVARQDPVYAVGFPQAIDLHEEATVTPGVVSRIIQAPDPLLEGQPRRVLQLTASVNPGNSGGPLLNDCAQVVGVVYAKRIGTEGMNFAIWSDLALPLLEAHVPDYERGPVSDEKAAPREIDRRGTRSVVLIAGRLRGGGVVVVPPGGRHGGSSSSWLAILLTGGTLAWALSEAGGGDGDGGNGTDTTPPRVPAGLTVTDTREGGTLALSWNANPESDLSRYNVYVGTIPGVPGAPRQSTYQTSVRLTGLTNGQTYYISLSAIDYDSNESNRCPERQGRPTDAVAPGAPTNVQVADTGLGESLSVTWQPPSDADLAGFRVRWGTTSGSYQQSADLEDGNSYTIGGLENGRTYYVAVRAYDTYGNLSANSAQASGTPSGPVTIAMDVAHEGRIDTAGQSACYRVPVQAGQHVFFMLRKPNQWDCTLSVSNSVLPDGSYDARSYGTSDLICELPSTQAGYCYLRVASRYNGTGAFTLKPTTQLTQVPMGGSLADRQIEHAGVVRWFKVNPGAGRHLFVCVKKPSQWDSYVTVRQGTLTGGDPVVQTHSADDLILDVPSCVAGAYYITVWGYSNATGLFSLEAREGFTQLALGEHLEDQTISRAGQFRAYQVRPGAGTHLFVLVRMPSKWDCNVAVYPGSLSTGAVTSGHADCDQVLEVASCVQGLYYLVVTGRYNATGSFSITATNSLPELELGQTLSNQAITRPGHRLWYQFTVPQETHLFLRLSKPSAWDSSVQMHRGSLASTPVDQTYGTGDLLLEAPSASAGTYYVGVYGRYDATGTFSLSPTTSLPAMTLNSPTAATIAQPGQMALYQLNPGAGTHLLVLVQKSASWDCRAALYCGAIRGATPVDEASGTGDLILEAASCAPGLYYVVLSGRYDNTGSCTLTPCDSLPELPLGEVVDGQSITYAGDSNWYQVQAPASGRLFVLVDKEGKWETSTRLPAGLVDTTANLSAYGSAWDILLRAQPAPGTTCYVNVASRYSNTGSYRIKAMSDLPTLNLNEPLTDQSLDDAGDVRWYQYDASAGQRLFGRINKPHAWECTLQLRRGVIPGDTDDSVFNGSSDGYVQVSDAGADWVYLSVAPRYDQFGPFDIAIRDSFAALTLGQWLTDQSLDHAGDVKAYQVTVPAGRQLTVGMAKPETWESSLQVRRNLLPEGSTFDAQANGPGNLEAIVPSTQAGVYYLTVSSRYSQIGAFDLTATTSAASSAVAPCALAVNSLACSRGPQGAGIVCTLSTDALVEAEILNLAGRPVARLAERRCRGGESTVIPWNRCSLTGARAPAGRYLVRLLARDLTGHEVCALAPLELR